MSKTHYSPGIPLFQDGLSRLGKRLNLPQKWLRDPAISILSKTPPEKEIPFPVKVIHNTFFTGKIKYKIHLIDFAARLTGFLHIYLLAFGSGLGRINDLRSLASSSTMFFKGIEYGWRRKSNTYDDAIQTHVWRCLCPCFLLVNAILNFDSLLEKYAGFSVIFGSASSFGDVVWPFALVDRSDVRSAFGSMGNWSAALSMLHNALEKNYILLQLQSHDDLRPDSDGRLAVEGIRVIQAELLGETIDLCRFGGKILDSYLKSWDVPLAGYCLIAAMLRLPDVLKSSVELQRDYGFWKNDPIHQDDIDFERQQNNKGKPVGPHSLLHLYRSFFHNGPNPLFTWFYRASATQVVSGEAA